MRDLALGENGILAQGFSIRLVGVGAADLDKGQYRQMSLFDMDMQNTRSSTNDAKRAEKQRKLLEMTRSIEEKYGKGTIHKGN